MSNVITISWTVGKVGKSRYVTCKMYVRIARTIFVKKNLNICCGTKNSLIDVIKVCPDQYFRLILVIGMCFD